MEKYILAHDIGTSGNKASLFDLNGTLVDSATIPYETYYPQREWAEQNPHDWWGAVCLASKKVMHGREAGDVAAIAVSGQMMGCLPLDADGIPLTNSIIWSDARSEKQCNMLTELLGKEYYEMLTGQPASPNYTLPKMMWLKEHHPEIWEKVDCFLQSKDYINYCLTGTKYTDPTDAAYTIAYDITKGEWSDVILEAAGIEKRLFPKVVSCETVVGHVTEKAAAECGLRPGIPVVASAGDGSAAHIGGACVEHADAYLCLGSSTWIVATSDHLIRDCKGRMQSEPHVVPEAYVYLGTMQTGGFAHSWAKSVLFDSRISYAEIDEIAGRTKPCAGGAMFMPYLMGERSPWYDTKVNGAFLGLRQETGAGEALRAVMEGVGFNLNILLKLIKKEIDIHEIVLIGGGAKSRIWKQILADIFGITVLIPKNVESGTSIGAAIIAGIGCGFFEDYSVAKKFLEIEERVEPNPRNAENYRKQAEIFEDAYFALKEINERISELSATL